MVLKKIDKKRIKKTKKDLKKEEKELNLRREKFCELFASAKEFFGNGVQSYIEAYNINLSKKGAYNSARVSAHHLLTNPNILKRIDELLELNGLNDTFVDKQLAKVITQDAELKTKVSAIKEYNSMKGRHKPKQINITNIIDDEQLKKAKEELAALQTRD